MKRLTQACIFGVLLAVSMIGCAPVSKNIGAASVVSPDKYGRAFDAAVLAGRQRGYMPIVQNRYQGFLSLIRSGSRTDLPRRIEVKFDVNGGSVRVDGDIPTRARSHDDLLASMVVHHIAAAMSSELRADVEAVREAIMEALKG